MGWLRRGDGEGRDIERIVKCKGKIGREVARSFALVGSFVKCFGEINCLKLRLCRLLLNVRHCLTMFQGTAMIDIVSVRESDAGRYTCVADSGRDRASGELQLVGMSPHSKTKIF